ncbi:MAG TPA: hypothetical protein PK629_09745 [Oscillospiraceae bacterium]|nr:hypothetical protein [Oscillospiraceae bacterium]HPK34912.1 hypothetical protein [Oscillospiraceae bacterium]HPR75379.1 hypothetical protein [Oscillospiraceae bacterium]
MTTKDLKTELIKLAIPDNSYSLKGGLPNEMYCISELDGKWLVYYSERGIKSALKIFNSEGEACNYFLLWIKKIFKKA